MKTLNDKSKYIQAKMKAYYGTTALIILLGSFSPSYAMLKEDQNVERCKTPIITCIDRPVDTVEPSIQNGKKLFKAVHDQYEGPSEKQKLKNRKEDLGNKSNISIPVELEKACESLNFRFIEYARNLPLIYGRICFEKGYPRQIIIEQNEVKSLMGVEINENRNVAVPLIAEDRDDGWEMHDDNNLVSHKRYAVFVKKIFPDGREEELKADKKIVLEPYELMHEQYLFVNPPIIRNNIPTEQAFSIERTYKRGDGNICKKTEPNLKILNLELQHSGFCQNDQQTVSYQIVNCFGIDQAKRYAGTQNFTINTKTYAHQPRNMEWLDNDTTHESKQIADMWIDTIGAQDPSNILPPNVKVCTGITINIQPHIHLSRLADWLPGFNWKIPHSDRKY